MEYVIIGNGPSAIGAVEGIRQKDKTGKITLISDEKYHTYSRPLISYLLENKTDEEKMKYRPEDFYEKNGVSTLLGVKAEKIDKENKTVALSDGRKIKYDKLLAATGSSPFVPQIQGLERVEKHFSFMTLDDAKSLAAACEKENRVLIIGAGLIGLKCAEGIHELVGSIDIVDLSPRILSSILDSDGAMKVQKHLERNGIKFHLSTSVEKFESGEAYLQNKEKIPFDILVTAVGVRPNIALLSEIGAETGKGIIVDKKMKTSLPDIYAAGDCIETFDITAGTRKVLAILPNAYSEGLTAGINMAGGKKSFDSAFPMNAIGFFGLHILTAGTYTDAVYSEDFGETYKKLFCKDGFLTGFILIGNVNKAGIYTSIIRSRTPIKDIDFKLICREPSLAAFSRSYRDEKLGGITE